MYNFIKTSDKDTADHLREQGFNLISQEGKFYVFLNDDDKAKFSNEDKKKISYSNILSI